MKLKKKALWLVLLVAILPIATSAMINIAEACPIRVYVNPPEILNTSLGPGEEFTVNIVVDYVTEVAAYQFAMSFNPDVLHGVSVDNGPFLGSAGGDVILFAGSGFDNTEGTLGLFGAILDPPDEKNPTGEEGVLASVTFRVVGIGGSPIRLADEKDITMLLNKTGGTEFKGETAEAWLRPPGELPIPNPGFLAHAYFDNRPQVCMNPSLIVGVDIGKSFTVDLNAVNVTDLYSWEFYLNWTAPCLNVTSVIEGGFLKSEPDGTQFQEEKHNDEGYIYVKCARTGTSGISGSGILANITFLVTGEGISTLHLYNTKLLNSSGGTMPVGTSDGLFNNEKFHNMAITSVAPYPTQVEGGSGDSIYINVTVANMGSFNETGISVAAYYDENEIGAETGLSLDRRTNKTFTFVWNTTGISVGKYAIKANTTVLEEESSTTDNTRVYSMVTVSGINIAIISVETPVTNAFLGHNVSVAVKVENQGTDSMTFNVTAYYRNVATEAHGEIGMITVKRLDYGETKMLQFEWDTTGLELGDYAVSANATVLEGESNTEDNAFSRVGAVTLVLFQEVFPIELFVLVIVVIAIVVGSSVLLYRRRKKPPEF